jgi:hypothetical protein
MALLVKCVQLLTTTLEIEHEALAKDPICYKEA